jgi:ribonucleoside-diphosphate reductase alpha chain
MTAARTRLANRRASTTFAFQCEAHRYTATVSYFANGQLAEVFINSGRAGSNLDAVARDSAILASLGLQFGIPLDVIRRALLRDSANAPSSPLGVALDIVANGVTP